MPPSPPPYNTEVYIAIQSSEFEMTLAGTIEGSDLEAIQADLTTRLCVNLTDCTVTVTIKAGSTVLDVILRARASSASATTTVEAAATAFAASPPATIAGSSVEGVSTPVTTTELVPIDDDGDDGLSTGAIIGIAVGAGVFALVVIILLVVCMRKKSASGEYGGKPISA
jgi:hypothetical protein